MVLNNLAVVLLMLGNQTKVVVNTERVSCVAMNPRIVSLLVSLMMVQFIGALAFGAYTWRIFKTMDSDTRGKNDFAIIKVMFFISCLSIFSFITQGIRALAGPSAKISIDYVTVGAISVDLVFTNVLGVWILKKLMEQQIKKRATSTFAANSSGRRTTQSSTKHASNKSSKGTFRLTSTNSQMSDSDYNPPSPTKRSPPSESPALPQTMGSISEVPPSLEMIQVHIAKAELDSPVCASLVPRQLPN